MTSVTDWTEVEAAVAEVGVTYRDMIATRRDERDGSKKVLAAEDAFARAHKRRMNALLAAFDPELDYIISRDGEESPSLGAVLHRYYEETIVSKPGKRKVK